MKNNPEKLETLNLLVKRLKGASRDLFYENLPNPAIKSNGQLVCHLLIEDTEKYYVEQCKELKKSLLSPFYEVIEMDGFEVNVIKKGLTRDQAIELCDSLTSDQEVQYIISYNYSLERKLREKPLSELTLKELAQVTPE